MTAIALTGGSSSGGDGEHRRRLPCLRPWRRRAGGNPRHHRREPRGPGGAQIISASVGFCETDLTEHAIELTEWLLMSAAATGVTVGGK